MLKKKEEPRVITHVTIALSTSALPGCQREPRDPPDPPDPLNPSLSAHNAQVVGVESSPVRVCGSRQLSVSGWVEETAP